MTGRPDKVLLRQTHDFGEVQHSEHHRNIITAAKGGGIDFAGTLFANAIGFLLSIVLARLLGAEQLGLYFLASAVVAVLVAVSFLGLDGGISRFVPIALAQRDKARVWGILQIGIGVPVLLSLTLAFILLFAAEFLANRVFNEPSLAPVLRLFSLVIPRMVLARCLALVAQGFKRLQIEAYSKSIAGTLIRVVLSVILLVLGFGVMGVVFAQLVAVTATTAMLLYFVRRLVPLNRSLMSAHRNIGEMFRFSLPLYFSRLLNKFGGSFETLVLGSFGVAADVGVYSAVLRISGVGNMFFGSVKKTSTPVISELHSQGKYGELERFYQTTTKWAIMFNLPIFCTILLFADPLLSIFGTDFTVGAMGLIVLGAAALFNAGTGACGTVVNMTGHSKLSSVNSIIYLSVTLILDFLLIPRWGLIGAAWAGALTVVINNTLRLIEVYFLIPGLLPFNRSFLKLPAAGLMAVGLTYLLTRLLPIDLPLLQFAIMAPIMWAFYIIAILMLKLSDEERLILNRLQSRLRWRKA
jgi:O-antigen/teichoic acid export membrane protein